MKYKIKKSAVLPITLLSHSQLLELIEEKLIRSVSKKGNNCHLLTYDYILNDFIIIKIDKSTNQIYTVIKYDKSKHKFKDNLIKTKVLEFINPP